MKQKRTYVTLVLILAILCLGIAYAVIGTQTLEISGSAQATAAEGKVDVIFTAATPAEGENDNIVAKVDEDDSKKATIQVSGLTTAGQSATATYTITNQQTDMAATLKDAIVRFDNIKGTVTESEWFEVTCTTLKGKELEANNETNNNEKSSTTVEVTVTLRKTPVTTDDQTAAKANIFIAIDADPVGNANQAGA